MRTREAHSQQLAETHVFSPFRESLYSTLPAAHLGRWGGVARAAAPVVQGLRRHHAAPAARASATPAAQVAMAQMRVSMPARHHGHRTLTIEAGTMDREQCGQMHPRSLPNSG